MVNLLIKKKTLSDSKTIFKSMITYIQHGFEIVNTKNEKVLFVFVFVVSPGVSGVLFVQVVWFLSRWSGVLFCLCFVWILTDREQFSFV